MKADQVPWVGSENKHPNMAMGQLVRGLATKVLEPCRLPLNRIIGNERFIRYSSRVRATIKTIAFPFRLLGVCTC